MVPGVKCRRVVKKERGDGREGNGEVRRREGRPRLMIRFILTERLARRAAVSAGYPEQVPVVSP